MILIIIIGTIVSTILNLLLFIRCLTTRKYIIKVSAKPISIRHEPESMQMTVPPSSAATSAATQRRPHSLLFNPHGYANTTLLERLQVTMGAATNKKKRRICACRAGVVPTEKLAKTYRPPPRRPAKLSGSNISWPTQVRCGGRQQMAPMSEPIKRRFAPVPNERPPAGFGRFSSPYLPVQGVPLSQFSGEPLIIEESLYDDVPPSSVYPSDGQVS
ncbi:unnamed protein product [Dibothriocephalus latus]|uniref:Uncharacterized protein n=1 Tax=Dibothriocephalus latus TaxID=60516 RepID=A0A3P7LRX7_DIBLA|nr:unnamed protein product [Dibothriocephalus latus]